MIGAMHPPPPVRIGNTAVHPVTLDWTLDFLASAAQGPGKTVVCYVNAHAVNLAASDAAFRAALDAATLVFCDGKAVQWAAHMLGHPLPERFTPPDWIEALCSRAARAGQKIYFLGGKQGVAGAAAERLRVAIPGLEIQGAHGYFEHEPGGTARAIERINAFEPTFLLVGMGMPRQELWIQRNLPELRPKVVMSVGGMFDFVSGRKIRGPRWMTDRGLEWVTRLMTEPRRLGSRYMVGNPMFVARVIRQAVSERMGSTGSDT